MAQYTIEDTAGLTIMSQSDYRQLKDGISLSAIDYAMDNDKVDYVKIGRIRSVVMTEKSKNYDPNKNVRRTSIMHT